MSREAAIVGTPWNRVDDHSSSRLSTSNAWGEHERHRIRSHQPRDRGEAQDLRDDRRRRAGGRDRPGPRRPSGLGARHERRGAGQGHRPRRRAAHRAPRRARADHHARDGQADRAGPRRGRLQRGDLPVLRRQRRQPAGGRADRASGRRGLGLHPPQLGRPPARHHAVELPLLPGGALRRPEPGEREHDPAQARAAVPRVGGRDGADLPRGRRARGRVHQHLRDQRADRVGHRRPARAGRLAHRVRPRRRRGGPDRRPAPQEGRARARRLGPVHRARRPTTSTPSSSRPSAGGWRTPARPATRPSASSSSTTSTTASSRSSPRR